MFEHGERQPDQPVTNYLAPSIKMQADDSGPGQADVATRCGGHVEVGLIEEVIAERFQ